MNKITALILMGLCLLSALAADDYFIGSGTSAQNKVPTYGYNNYGWSKAIYSGDELAAAGISGTVQLTGMAYQVSNTISDYVMDNQLVYMRVAYNPTYGSSDTSYPSIVSGGWQQVFSGSVNWNGPGWQQITFTAPFNYTYTVGQNWGIEILWENRDGSKIGGPPSFYGTTVSNTCVYKSQDASFPTTSGTRSNYHPNLWLMTPVTDVPPPAVLPNPAHLATGVGIDTHISWSSGGGAPIDYLFSLWKTSPYEVIENNLVLTATSYTPATYLDYGTQYSWRVIPRNILGPATACPTWTFTTLADPAVTAFPWSEAFDGASFPPSSDWLTRNGALADPVTLVPSSLWDQDDWLNIAGTDQAAAISIWGSINGWLISPLLKITSPDFLLSFDLAWLKYDQPPTGTPPDPSGTDDRFAVLIGNGFTWSTANIAREWNNTGSQYVLNELSPSGQKVTIPLSAYSGNIRLAFYAGSTTSNADNDFMVNNITVREALQTPVTTIAVDPDSGIPALNWSAVPNAVLYKIYRCDTPYGTFELVGTSETTTYPIAPTAFKAFYQIVASSVR